MNTQKSMWNSYFDAMQGAPNLQAARCGIKRWISASRQMGNMFKARRWMQAWVEDNKIEGMPEAAVAYTKQFQEMVKQWSETQKKLWANWVGYLRNFDPDKRPGSWEQHGQSHQSWQNLPTGSWNRGQNGCARGLICPRRIRRIAWIGMSKPIL
jgi:hypothetical protein